MTGGGGTGGTWMAGSARAAGGSRNFKLWVPGTVEGSLEKGRAWPLVMVAPTTLRTWQISRG
jgi:hypothetical protein